MKHPNGWIVLLAIWLAFANPLPATAGQSDCVISGDSNADGVFDLNDLLLLMDWLDGPPPTTPALGTPVFLATDVNGNSLIDWNDFFLYLDKLNGVISEFPFPITCTFQFSGYSWLAFDVST